MSLPSRIYANLSTSDIEALLASTMKESSGIAATEKVGPYTWKIRMHSSKLNIDYVVFAELMNEPEDGAGLSLSCLSGSAGVSYELLNRWNADYRFTKAYINTVHDKEFLILQSDLMSCLGITTDTLKGFFFFFCESWVPLFIEFLRAS